MSLLEDAYEDFIIINKAVVDDGYGGTTTVWTPGATIQGAITFDASSVVKVAEALGATAIYTLTVKKSVDLDFHTVLKRKADNRIFRTTANSDDRKTPESAGLDMRQYSVEEWKLT